MQGKMKSFFEDVGIILVLSVTIYGGYYAYTTFSSETPTLSSIKESIEKIIIVKKEPLADDNKSVQIKEVVTEVIIKQIENENNIEKKVQKQEIVNVSTPLFVEKTELKEKETKKHEVSKETSTFVSKNTEVKKEKNVDLAMLKIFLRNIKIRMAGNIVKRDDIDTSISQELKIRVTVLKDGSYEDLIFVNGDKKLFEKNKEHIVKVFPVRIDDKIKDEFPRYVRISIK